MKRTNTELARNLRREQTPAERLLWNHLNAKQLGSLKFRRQHPIGDYIVDFVCPAKLLIIELDGGQHDEANNRINDAQRAKVLEAMGYQVIRFWNSEVLQNPEGVILVIRQCLGFVE
ncbi:adenine-specific DNA-methyltransferase [Dehalogenimonas formicexedens]|uniref:Adenine-specific DNA-methyltransferase n=1 Tax=Dehalogenimonas formicexedens TaxID=1839801 RepID=A0A1P8FAB0_9CHLR|nr:endonuclease domain-containing protein [Dehalogenimonas formicexedens]APV45399.1 adenine-specific DNA-methyltransferase [Dehalogenimonas formicexedens]